MSYSIRQVRVFQDPDGAVRRKSLIRFHISFLRQEKAEQLRYHPQAPPQYWSISENYLSEAGAWTSVNVQVCVWHPLGCISITFHKIWNLHHLPNTQLRKSYALTRSYFIHLPDPQVSVIVFDIRNQTQALDLHIQEEFLVLQWAVKCNINSRNTPDDWIASTIYIIKAQFLL